MKQHNWVTIAILTVGFICAFYGAGCDKEKDAPDSPRPDVGDFRDYPSGATVSDSVSAGWIATASEVLTNGIYTTYYFDDGNRASVVSYGNLEVTNPPQRKTNRLPEQDFLPTWKNCNGDMTIVVRFHDKFTWLITGVPSCSGFKIYRETESVAFDGTSCGCTSRIIHCASH